MVLHLAPYVLYIAIHGQVWRLKVIMDFHDLGQVVEYGVPSSWFINDVHCSLNHAQCQCLFNREQLLTAHDQFPGQSCDVK